MPNTRCTMLCSTFTGKMPSARGAVSGSGSMLPIPVARNPAAVAARNPMPNIMATFWIRVFIVSLQRRDRTGAMTPADCGSIDELVGPDVDRQPAIAVRVPSVDSLHRLELAGRVRERRRMDRRVQQCRPVHPAAPRRTIRMSWRTDRTASRGLFLVLCLLPFSPGRAQSRDPGNARSFVVESAGGTLGSIAGTALGL